MICCQRSTADHALNGCQTWYLFFPYLSFQWTSSQNFHHIIIFFLFSHIQGALLVSRFYFYQICSVCVCVCVCYFFFLVGGGKGIPTVTEDLLY